MPFAMDHNALLDRLDDLLLQDWMPNASMDLSMLDGFFTAVISSPGNIPIEQVLPWIWDVEEGIAEAEFPSQETADEVLGLIRQHWDHVAKTLGQAQDQYAPVLFEDESGVVIEDWCMGYIAGMQLDSKSWDPLPEELRDLLEPVFLYGTEEGADMLKELNLSREQHDDIAHALPDVALTLYDAFHPAVKAGSSARPPFLLAQEKSP